MKRPGDPCPWCERPLNKGFVETRMREAHESRLTSLNERRKKGLHIGRPRTSSYDEIRKLRKSGMS